GPAGGVSGGGVSGGGVDGAEQVLGGGIEGRGGLGAGEGGQGLLALNHVGPGRVERRLHRRRRAEQLAGLGQRGGVVDRLQGPVGGLEPHQHGAQLGGGGSPGGEGAQHRERVGALDEVVAG